MDFMFLLEGSASHSIFSLEYGFIANVKFIVFKKINFFPLQMTYDIILVSDIYSG